MGPCCPDAALAWERCRGPAHVRLTASARRAASHAACANWMASAPRAAGAEVVARWGHRQCLWRAQAPHDAARALRCRPRTVATYVYNVCDRFRWPVTLAHIAAAGDLHACVV